MAAEKDEWVPDAVEKIESSLKQQSRSFSRKMDDVKRQFFGDVGALEGMRRVLCCLLYLLGQEHDGHLKHLLVGVLGQLSEENSGVEKAELRNLFVPLFEGYCRADSARLAVKIAKLFHLSTAWLSKAKLVAYIQRLFEDRGTYTPALQLFMHFSDLKADFDDGDIIKKLVDGNAVEKSMDWVQTLDVCRQREVIEQCIAVHKLRTAWVVAKAVNLDASYSHVRKQIKAEQVHKHLSKRSWSLAFAAAEDNRDLQILIVETMVISCDMDMAAEYQKRLQLPESVLVADEALRERCLEEKLQTYYQLQIPMSAIAVVESSEQLKTAHSVLCVEDRIGFDVEWSPQGSAQNASTLQIAGRNCCFILDLISLRGSAVLKATMADLFCNAQILKLGFSLSEDLRALKAICDVEQAVRVCDLQERWPVYARVKKIEVLACPLEGFATDISGKPLDKSMQTSDWNERPLLESQIRYAANDAHVLHLIYEQFAQAGICERE